MKIGTRPLLVMHGDPTLRHRLRDLAGAEFIVRQLQDWATLAEEVQASSPSAVVVLDPYAERSSGDRFAPKFFALLAEFPSIPVIAAVSVTPTSVPDLVALSEAGVVDVIAIGHDDTETALRTRFRMALGRPLKLLLDTVLPTATPARARVIVDSAAEVVSAGKLARDLAGSLSLSRRTLLRWAEAAELPPPRRLLAWMRVLLAASMLDDPGRRVLDVAVACGYSADPGLRRVMMKYLGVSPTHLRRAGAFKLTAEAFLRDLEKYRARES